MYELHHFWRQEWRVGGEAQEKGPSYVLAEKWELEQQAVGVVESNQNFEAVGRPYSLLRWCHGFQQCIHNNEVLLGIRWKVISLFSQEVSPRDDRDSQM